ncbi:MAG TPA: phosphodiester glycosidase family protein [Fimbriimonadaceae bacterium]|nr:phosphodiester glycosidase family protein [Fimbriimonadaceae bacterium]
MVIALALALLPEPSPVSLEKGAVLGVPVSSIKVNLKSARVGLILADGFPGTDQDFASMIRKHQPLVAVNGAYFSKETLLPIGDLVLNGQLVHSGRMGTALTFGEEGKPDIQRVVRHKTMRWEGFRTVLACGPALILDGKVDVDFASEGFRDPHVTGSAQRMAVGYTVDNRLIIAHIRKAVTFSEEAKIMRELGCFEAMNLDAGASLAMHFDGKTVTKPGRKLTNLLAVWSD